MSDNEQKNMYRYGLFCVLHNGSPSCPKCGSLPKEHEVKSHDPMWGDGKVYCKKCGEYVRDYNSD